MSTVKGFTGVRLPQWLLPADWPMHDGEPVLAVLPVSQGRFAKPEPVSRIGASAGMVDVNGLLALPPLVDAHTHLDKTYTRSRLGPLAPGLLPAITAMREDQAAHWTYDDLLIRAKRAVAQARAQGTHWLRTHIDWDSPNAPLAWHVIGELARDLHEDLRLQRVALVPLPLLADASVARQIVRQVARSDNAQMGGFIHSSNFDASALEILVREAESAGVSLDLHIDEELSDQACGFEVLVNCLEQTRFSGRVVCGHVCALTTRQPSHALRLLDRAARLPITLVALPATNLFLQDAGKGQTPRLRGLTLINEARDRRIPCLIASDNVQDAFNPLGNYDLLEQLRLAVYAAHLDRPFDQASQMICRSDWLEGDTEFTLEGRPAQLLLFATSDVWSWPSGQPWRWLDGCSKPHLPAESVIQEGAYDDQ